MAFDLITGGLFTANPVKQNFGFLWIAQVPDDYDFYLSGLIVNDVIADAALLSLPFHEFRIVDEEAEFTESIEPGQGSQVKYRQTIRATALTYTIKNSQFVESLYGKKLVVCILNSADDEVGNSKPPYRCRVIGTFEGARMISAQATLTDIDGYELVFQAVSPQKAMFTVVPALLDPTTITQVGAPTPVTQVSDYPISVFPNLP